MLESQALQLTDEQMQAISRALADPRRFAILQQIAREETMLCVALDARNCISPATISHHLKELQMAGLVEAQREGRAMKLSLRRDVWEAYVENLRKI